jgi:hypothetical protein
VSAPAEADLIFELHFKPRTGVVGITNLPTGKVILFYVVILDLKTHVTLWELTQIVQGATRDATGRKNFSQAMTNLVDSVKKLSGQSVAAADGGRKQLRVDS